TFGHCAVAKKHHGHRAALAHAVRSRTTQGNRYPGPNDAIGAEHAEAHVGDVHRSTAAPADATRSSQDFLEEKIERDPTRDHVAMAAMVGSHRIALLHRGHHPRR